MQHFLLSYYLAPSQLSFSTFSLTFIATQTPAQAFSTIYGIHRLNSLNPTLLA